MGIFSRLTDIINANINSLLERAEDPEKMARLMIQEMEDTLIEVRSEAVRNIAEKRDLERRLQKLGDAGSEWQSKAEFALSKGRDDLAKGALIARRKVNEQAQYLRGELAALEDTLARHNGDLARLQAKLEEAKARKKAFELRIRTAKERVRVKRTLHDERVDDALDRYESLERRIDELEASADVYDMGQPRTLAEEFADLEVQAEVEDELVALKARVQEAGGS
ncbi:MAG: phage shock protein PspA [Gammaproteobacteria bacterium]|nr:phage shock protein PspA [Gammaproteobacteria bacterium]